MRDCVSNLASVEAPEKLLNFPGAPTRYDRSAAPDLVSQTTEMIRGIQDRAFETSARAKTLVEGPVEKTRLGDESSASTQPTSGMRAAEEHGRDETAALARVSQSASLIVIDLGDGRRIRLDRDFDAEALKRVLDVLDRRR
jgi:transposase